MEAFIKKYLIILSFVISCSISCQEPATTTSKKVLTKDEYSAGIIDLQLDTTNVKSALNFLSASSYSESDGYGTIILDGSYAGRPTKWTVTFKSNKAVIVSFDYSTQDTTSASLIKTQDWVVKLKQAVTKRYGQPWKDGLHGDKLALNTTQKIIWRRKVNDLANGEIIFLSLSSDEYEHPPFTHHYDIQFKHFYISDAPKWYRTMIE
jgi:hypothetical protein